MMIRRPAIAELGDPLDQKAAAIYAFYKHTNRLALRLDIGLSKFKLAQTLQLLYMASCQDLVLFSEQVIVQRRE